MRILLDTNAYSALFRGEETVATRVRHADHVLMSTIVIGELLFGFRYGRHYEANRRELEEFLGSTMESGAELLSFDRHFGEVDGITWTQL